MSDEEAYADFAKRYGEASSDYELACVLSGRLRDLDKRTKAANQRADAAEAALRAADISQALSVLARVHTRDDHQVGFVVMAGAGPDWGNLVSHDEYLEAWQTVRKTLQLPTMIQTDPA